MKIYVSEAVLMKMERDADFLFKLSAAGVDSWEGCDEVEVEEFDSISEIAVVFEFASFEKAQESIPDAVEIEDIPDFISVANAQLELQAFEAAGVNNWDGYEIAQDM